MSRRSRLVVPGYPHHIVQRGNRCQKAFFSDEDRHVYLDFLIRYAKPEGITFWAYCLMDNHVHLIAVPKDKDSLAAGIGEAHRRYTARINLREGWKGYLWQGRFFSCALDQTHLYAAVRYVEQNPVRAGIVKNAGDYAWSSAKSHIKKMKDILCSPFYLLDEIPDWSKYLASAPDENKLKLIRKHTKTGRPLGNIPLPPGPEHK